MHGFRVRGKPFDIRFVARHREGKGRIAVRRRIDAATATNTKYVRYVTRAHEPGDAKPVNSQAETISPCGNKCMIFRRKAGASINETAMPRNNHWFVEEHGERMSEDGRGPLL